MLDPAASPPADPPADRPAHPPAHPSADVPAGGTAVRRRADRCPGLARPWPADDGLLVRLRLVGGRTTRHRLAALLDVAERWGDGRVHLTGRANLQLRALPAGPDGGVLREAAEAVRATGLVPRPSHELVRNVMVSPQTGLAGGRADLRPVAAGLDTALCADPDLAALPGRFLFVLDDGRGDLADRGADLGVVALEPRFGQLRVGDGWGPVVPLVDVPARLVALARAFLVRRGTGPAAAWHVRELDAPLVAEQSPDPRAGVRSGPLPHGPVPGGRHLGVPDGVLDRALLEDLAVPDGSPLVVTPWHGLLVPEVAA